MMHIPRVYERVGRLPGFRDLHPHQEDEGAQGALELMWTLQRILAEVAGLPAVTLQPAAGSQGELTGLMLMRAYFADRGEERDTIVTADTAHGTTPASVTMAGYKLARDYATEAPGGAGGTVPATLALTLGAAASFGAFTPGVDRDYTATTTATVVSTAADATLSASEHGRLANGAFTLAEPPRVEIAPASWSGPVSNATSTITFRQHIGAAEPLRTGRYATTLTFTLSTTTP